MRFVDTNVILYAISGDPADTDKAERALALLNEPDLGLSVQVLQEFYVQATRPAGPASVSHERAVALIHALLRFPVQELTVPLLEAALAVRQRWQLSYWDAAIVAAALSIGCDTLCTEDLQHGQDFDGLRVFNPFL
jgi:predicted nucleic acid-binding protein